MFRKTLVNLIIALAIIFFTAVNSQAQNGLGDPIINFSFGAGAPLHGPEFPGIIGINGEYAYSSSNTPPTGTYITVNNTNFAPAIWWPTTDHTPNEDNGYMLVVKTRTNGYEVLFRHVINNLCPGTHYEFKAYMLNLSRNGGGIAPEMIMRVQTLSDVTIEERELGAINYEPAGPQWLPKSVDDFVVPPGVTSVVVSIISKTPGGPSNNDLAIDDVTVNAKGQKIDAIFNDGNPSWARSTCADSPEPFPVTATAPDPGNLIRWQRKLNDGAWEYITTPGISPDYTITSETAPGFYRYRAASAPPDNIDKFECSVVSNELTVWVKPLVSVNANINTSSNKLYLRGGPPIQLQGSTNSSDFNWEVEPGYDIGSLSSTTVLNPQASPNVTTTYILRARPDINTCGTAQEDRVTVLVADDIKLPNTFTPNGDGINDRWVIGGLNAYPDAVTQVYNRNGQLIFRSVGGSASPWDGTYKGKNVPAGNYYYIVDLNIANLRLSGSVTVIR